MDIPTQFMAAATVLAAVLPLAPALAPEGKPFASRAEAEDYLARALPEATAANPSYKDPNGDLSTRWLTTSVEFRPDKDGGIVVAMHEDVLKYRGDSVVSRGTHDVEVPLEMTGVGLIGADWKPVDTVEAAAGLLFRCPGEPCVPIVRDDKPSVEAQVDITISNRDTLAKLFAAFRALLKSSALP